jgi:hypothetical protein
MIYPDIIRQQNHKHDILPGIDEKKQGAFAPYRASPCSLDEKALINDIINKKTAIGVKTGENRRNILK